MNHRYGEIFCVGTKCLRVRALCVLSKRDRYVHACACACSRWVDVCAVELVSLPMRACACMHVCVDRGTPGGDGVGQ